MVGRAGRVPESEVGCVTYIAGRVGWADSQLLSASLAAASSTLLLLLEKLNIHFLLIFFKECTGSETEHD